MSGHGHGTTRLAQTLDLVESVRKLLGAYAREITARSRWAAEAEPWSPQSKAMFGAVLDREAETRDAALAVGAIVFPAETGALPPPASRREETPKTSNGMELRERARALVASSPLHKRFIAHTPLENDIAVWIEDFASAVLEGRTSMFEPKGEA